MKGDFTLAVHALVFLNHKQSTVSSEVLAENICTNAARVRKVMACLKRAGLVETKEGRQGGGYLFALDAGKVTLDMIAQAAGTDFVTAGWKSGDIEKDCLVSSGMGAVMDSLYSELNLICRNRLEQITVADIDRQIFEK